MTSAREEADGSMAKDPRSKQELTPARTGLDDKAIEDKITTLVKEAAAK